MNSTDMTPEMAEFFGVAGDDPDGIKDGNGVIVTELIDETGEPADSGPAAKAGIKDGDVIVKFGRKDITELWDLRNAAANTPPGKEVRRVQRHLDVYQEQPIYKTGSSCASHQRDIRT